MDGARKSRRSNAASKGATRSAQSRKCPRCLRLAALSAPVVWPGIGRARKCNYCGHEVGIIHGESFGRDVTPELGVRSA
jgi:hypothetical protein